jgi:hypothetical protein
MSMTGGCAGSDTRFLRKTFRIDRLRLFVQGFASSSTTGG